MDGKIALGSGHNFFYENRFVFVFHDIQRLQERNYIIEILKNQFPDRERGFEAGCHIITLFHQLLDRVSWEERQAISRLINVIQEFFLGEDGRVSDGPILPDPIYE